MNTWRNENHIEDHRLQKDNMVKKASMNKSSNQNKKIQRSIWTKEDIVMIRAKKCSK
jgi:hypothetical protein